MRYMVGIDVGGTFTDFVAYDSETKQIQVWKHISVPRDPGDGILRRELPRRHRRFAGRFCRGAERALSEVVPALARRGHDATAEGRGREAAAVCEP